MRWRVICAFHDFITDKTYKVGDIIEDEALIERTLPGCVELLED